MLTPASEMPAWVGVPTRVLSMVSALVLIARVLARLSAVTMLVVSMPVVGVPVVLMPALVRASRVSMRVRVVAVPGRRGRWWSRCVRRRGSWW
ncbi:hypothetical protein GCM10010116_48980 [Microbispora rosea subsp. aerata]|nr:hypothetical protein GCM10010116_48980 [Microbispora rosea subsp. aerata]